MKNNSIVSKIKKNPIIFFVNNKSGFGTNNFDEYEIVNKDDLIPCKNEIVQSLLELAQKEIDTEWNGKFVNDDLLYENDIILEDYDDLYALVNHIIDILKAKGINWSELNTISKSLND